MEKGKKRKEKRRDAEISEAMRRTPRGSEIRKEKKRKEAQRISEGCRECQVTKRRKRKREREEENTIENNRGQEKMKIWR